MDPESAFSLKTHRNRCGLCGYGVGVGVQCSLCHNWYHLAPDPETLQKQQQEQQKEQAQQQQQQQQQLQQNNNNNQGGDLKYQPSSMMSYSSFTQGGATPSNLAAINNFLASMNQGGTGSATNSNLQSLGTSPQQSPQHPNNNNSNNNNNNNNYTSATQSNTTSTSNFLTVSNLPNQNKENIYNSNNSSPGSSVLQPNLPSATSAAAAAAGGVPNSASGFISGEQSRRPSQSGLLPNVSGSSQNPNPNNNNNNQSQQQQQQQRKQQPQCKGIDFPKYFPFFCESCEYRCSLVEMTQINEIYSSLLQEEKDEVTSGAPQIFSNCTASFIRKRVRAIGKGPAAQESRFDSLREANLLNSGGESSAGGGGGGGTAGFEWSTNAGPNPHATGTAALQIQQSMAFTKSKSGGIVPSNEATAETLLPALIDFFDDGRAQAIQLKWEKLFTRQALQTVRKVLAVPFPQAYDDSALIQAAKRARARSYAAEKAAAASGASSNASASFFSGNVTEASANYTPASARGGGGGGGGGTADERAQQRVNKFFGGVSFVAPSLVTSQEEDEAEQKALEGLRKSGKSKRKFAAREQDVEMMEMQHDVTLHRLKWTPHELGTSGVNNTGTSSSNNVGGGNGSAQVGQVTENFGPHPIYVNPITSQIRLSEVKIEVKPENST